MSRKAKTTSVSSDVAASSAAVVINEARLIPLSQLSPQPSKLNVRTTAANGIDSLADSIAAVGLLQNLVVIPSKGDRFEVIAGGRRLAALRLLAKRKVLAADHPVPCMLADPQTATSTSLTENVQREAMHPADEFAAFAKLAAEGKPVEDIAATFGVTPLVVQRRLKLAALSARLMTDFRAGVLTLDQMMALTLTDDHAAQEAAFYNAPEWARSAGELRHRLIGAGVRSTDRRVRFVGLDAYRKAGGAVRVDLFADADAPTFLDDVALLDRLVDDKMRLAAAKVEAEGWLWVGVVPMLSYTDTQGMRRVPTVRRQPSPEEAARIAEIEARAHSVQAALREAEDANADDDAARLEDELTAIDDELEALRETLDTLPSFAPTVAGVMVSLDHDGGLVIDRGYVQRSDFAKFDALLAAQSRRDGAPSLDADASGNADERQTDHPMSEDEDVIAGPVLSAGLARELSAYRTAALQWEVSQRPHTALVLLVERLAAGNLLGQNLFGGDGMTIRPSIILPLDRIGDPNDRPCVLRNLKALKAFWQDKLALNPTERMAQLCAMSQADLLELLALCVGSSIDARIDRPTQPLPATAMAEAVSLDMAAHWSATVATYFGQVTKRLILDAVNEFAPAEVQRLAALKRKEMAEEAERLARGTGWLPPMLRRPASKPERLPRKEAVASIAVADDRLDGELVDESEPA